MEHEILKQLLQGLNELKSDIKELKAEQGEIKTGLGELKVDQKKLQQDFTEFKEEYRRDMQRIDVRLNATNERLDTFKFDTDLLIEKNAKLEFRVNRIEKNFEV